MKCLESQKGFSLIEVLVAMGLASLVGLIVTSLITSSLKSQAAVDSKEASRNLAAEIKSILSNQSACLNTFSGTNISSGSINVSQVKDETNADKYISDSSYFGGKVIYKNLVLQNFIPDGSNPHIGKAKLFIYSTKPQVGQDVQLMHSILSLQMTKDATGQIMNCYTLGGSTDSFWQISPTNPNNIYYMAGNVGIGANSPTEKLHISGNLFLNRSTGDSGLVLQNSSGTAFWISSPTTNILSIGGTGATIPATGAINISTSGNIGIAGPPSTHQLEVTGSIHSSTNIAANAINAATSISTATLNASGSVFASSFIYTSDQRLKKNIHNLSSENISSKFNLLKPVKFDWKNKDLSDYGFIAQDVEKIFPELVVENSEGLKAVKYGNMVALLTQVIKEQQIEIQKLKNQMQTLNDHIKNK